MRNFVPFNSSLFLIFIGTFAAFSPNLMAWGCEGHQVVAYIAEREMNPVALSNANKLLTAFPITIHRFCTASPGTTPLSDAATWADDVRSTRKDTASWHFIDVPLGNAGDNPNQWCNDSCVLTALNNQRDILRNASPDASDIQTVEALRFIIHFMGDVHQPLHAITNTDRGGNCDPIAINKRKPHLSGTSYSPELHGIWDTNLVVELQDRSDVDDAAALAQLLDGEITAEERQNWKTGAIDDWAIESSKLAASKAYAGLTNKHGGAVPSSELAGSEKDNKCVLTKEKAIVTLGLTASADYQDVAEAVIEERLKQAGFRLANMLNEIWPDDEVQAAHRTVHKKHTNR